MLTAKKVKYVAKGNELIEGLSDLELLDFKLINLVISKIDSINDNDLKTFVLNKRDIMDYLNLNNNYGKLNKLLKTIPYKKVIINTKENYKTCYWFHVTVSKSQVEFNIDERLKPYLIKLSDNFTQYELSSIKKFKSKYSSKFYEWFLMKYNKNKQYKESTSLIIELEQLKEYLFLPKSYSKNFNEIKRRVITPALNDINNYTQLTISYNPIYSGMKVEKVEFLINISQTKCKNENDKNNLNNENINNLKNNDFNLKKSAKEFFKTVWVLYPLQKNLSKIKIDDMINLQKLGYDVVKTCVDRYKEFMQERRKELPQTAYQYGDTFFKKGYVDYLDENYTPYKALSKNSSNNVKPTQSTNYEQRKYDDEFIDSLYDNF